MKLVHEKKLQADAPPGHHYVRQNLGFSDNCAVCKQRAKMFTFARSIEPAGPKDPCWYNISSLWVCSVDCYKTTAEYRENQRGEALPA